MLSHFDAFKFPSSEVVQFRALVTPCMPTCEPVQCNEDEKTTGEFRSVVSFGKRRRRRSASVSQDDMLLVQSIQITDKFGFETDVNKSSMDNEPLYIPNDSICINIAGLFLTIVIFISTQFAIMATWTFICQKRKISKKMCADQMSVSVSIPSQFSSRSDSLCKLYENGFTHSRRF